MPVVTRGQRNTSIAAIPGARRQAAETALSQGAGVAQAKAQKFETIEHVGGAAARVGASLYERLKAEEKQNADNTALLKASNQIAEWKAKRLFDPEKGAFAMKGEAAQPLPEQLRGEYDTLTSDIAKGLTADQQAQFSKLRSGEWQQLDLQVRRHVFDQMQAFKAGELESAISNHVNAAQQNFLDPKLVGIELAKAIDALEVNAPALGMGKEQLEAKKRGITSDTHVGVIGNLLGADKAEAAKIYFEGVRTQIDGKVIDEVEKALQVGTDKKEAQKAFDSIMASEGSWDEKRKAARAIEDADQRDMVESYLDHEEALQDRRERETHKDTVRGAYDIIDAGKGIRGIPAATWSQLEGDERRSLQIYAQAKAEGIPIKTDQTVFYKYMRMAADDPAAFIRSNILTDKHKLSDGDFQQLAGLQVSISNGDRVAAGKLLDDYRTETQVISQALTSARIDPSPDPKTKPNEAAAVANLQRMVADRVQQLQANTGKKANNKDVQQIVDDILQQSVDTPGSWWALWQNTGTKRLIETQIDDIPNDEQERVRNFLKASGIPDTDDNILAYWIDARARMRKKK